MKKIIIFGTGKGANKVWGYLKISNCNVLCFLDNNESNCNKKYLEYDVKTIKEMPKDFDFMIISAIKMEYINEIYTQLVDMGLERKKIIPFFDKSRINNFELYSDFIDISAWQIFLLDKELNYWKKLVSDIDSKYAPLLVRHIKQKQEEKKISIYIFGTGKGEKEIENYLYLHKCDIIGYIDNDPQKCGKLYKGKKILTIDKIRNDYDYIIISTKKLEYTRSIAIQLAEEGVDQDKVIPFFDSEKVIIKNEYAAFVNIDSWRGILLNREIQNYERTYKIKIENMKYEIMDEVKNEKVKLPQIVPISETLDLIINKNCSIVRFGDGEFGLIDKHRFHKFQKNDDKLAERLAEVLDSNEERCLVAIADNYGSLEQMTDRGAESIRMYMTSGAREIQMRMLNLDRKYHNAYLTRPYIYFKDKDNAGKRFNNIKKIWENRDVVIIEGHETRLGIGNDLLDQAKSVRRILGPSTNAFDYYDAILKAALRIEKSVLFLVALGPTATVLTYDLYKYGYQAIDIGHIDVEYEWYRLGVENPVKLGNKYVCEAPNGDMVEEIGDEKYLRQIIDRVY